MQVWQGFQDEQATSCPLSSQAQIKGNEIKPPIPGGCSTPPAIVYSKTTYIVPGCKSTLTFPFAALLCWRLTNVRKHTGAEALDVA